MTDVYKVGISVKMTNMVSTVLRVIVKDLKLANVSATAFKRTLSELKVMGMIGVAAGVTGGAGLYGLGKLYESASEYQTALNKLKSMGVGDAMVKEGDKFARGTQVIGASATDLITQVRDLTTVLGKDNFKLAMQIAPTMAQINYANHSLFPDKYNEGQALALEKVIEMKGGWKSAADFNRQAEMMEKVFAGTGGMVTPSDYLAFIKTAGVAGRLMSDKAFYYEMEPMIQEMGGNRVGTAIMSAYNNLGQGRATVRSAREMMKLGLLDPKNVEYDKIGQVKSIHPGSLKNFDTFTSDPGEWLMKTLVPTLQAAGFKTKEQMMNEMGVIFGNRTGSALYSLMLMQWEKIEKNMQTTQGAMGIQDLIKLAKTSPTGAMEELGKSWTNLKIAAGMSLIPVVIPVLNHLASTFRWLADAMTRHPIRTEYIVRSIAAVSGVLVALAAAMPFAMAFRMLQFVGATKMLGTVLRGTGYLLTVIATPMVAFAAVVIGVGAAILYTMPTMKTFKEAWVQLGELLKMIAGAVVKLGHALKDLIVGNSGLGVIGSSHDKSLHFVVNTHLDGRRIAQSVTQHQAKAGNKPSSGPSGFNVNQSYSPVGVH